jgi:UDP-N-acetylglucosamine--N-acetylmuramyl-(pentapeptide) pyrophosphoryl-undecaprenol N-acetylglucosamine transferase
MVGGGSGGHILPVKALIEEIIKQKPKSNIVFWTDKKFFDLSKKIIGKKFFDVKIQLVVAGKFRRYRHGGISLKELFLNIRDVFLVLIGFWQSLARLIFNRPDVIFLKGGYVGLPVGMAAVMLRIPFVVHDSDTVLGLTNKILGKFAKRIAVSWPIENYTGALVNKMVFTGIPVSSDVLKYQNMPKEKIKKQLGFNSKKPLVVAVGGGLGARSVNLAIVHNLDNLLEKYTVVLVTGQGQYAEIKRKTVKYVEGGDFWLFDFLTDGLGELLAAADVVVARAGATTLVELMALKKAAIIVPNDFLTGGHQTKNALVLEKAHAVLKLDDQSLNNKLVDGINEIMGNVALRQKLETNIGRFANNSAAVDLAKLLIDVVK